MLCSTIILLNSEDSWLASVRILTEWLLPHHAGDTRGRNPLQSLPIFWREPYLHISIFYSLCLIFSLPLDTHTQSILPICYLQTTTPIPCWQHVASLWFSVSSCLSVCSLCVYVRLFVYYGTYLSSVPYGCHGYWAYHIPVDCISLLFNSFQLFSSKCKQTEYTQSQKPTNKQVEL